VDIAVRQKGKILDHKKCQRVGKEEEVKDLMIVKTPWTAEDYMLDMPEEIIRKENKIAPVRCLETGLLATRLGKVQLIKSYARDNPKERYEERKNERDTERKNERDTEHKKTTENENEERERVCKIEGKEVVIDIDTSLEEDEEEEQEEGITRIVVLEEEIFMTEERNGPELELEEETLPESCTENTRDNTEAESEVEGNESIKKVEGAPEILVSQDSTDNQAKEKGTNSD
jgi:hypothetical protein